MRRFLSKFTKKKDEKANDEEDQFSKQFSNEKLKAWYNGKDYSKISDPKNSRNEIQLSDDQIELLKNKYFTYFTNQFSNEQLKNWYYGKDHSKISDPKNPRNLIQLSEDEIKALKNKYFTFCNSTESVVTWETWADDPVVYEINVNNAKHCFSKIDLTALLQKKLNPFSNTPLTEQQIREIKSLLTREELDEIMKEIQILETPPPDVLLREEFNGYSRQQYEALLRELTHLHQTNLDEYTQRVNELRAQQRRNEQERNEHVINEQRRNEHERNEQRRNEQRRNEHGINEQRRNEHGRNEQRRNEQRQPENNLMNLIPSRNELQCTQDQYNHLLLEFESLLRDEDEDAFFEKLHYMQEEVFKETDEYHTGIPICITVRMKRILDESFQKFSNLNVTILADKDRFLPVYKEIIRMGFFICFFKFEILSNENEKKRFLKNQSEFLGNFEINFLQRKEELREFQLRFYFIFIGVSLLDEKKNTIKNRDNFKAARGWFQFVTLKIFLDACYDKNRNRPSIFDIVTNEHPYNHEEACFRSMMNFFKIINEKISPENLNRFKKFLFEKEPQILPRRTAPTLIHRTVSSNRFEIPWAQVNAQSNLLLYKEYFGTEFHINAFDSLNFENLFINILNAYGMIVDNFSHFQIMLNFQPQEYVEFFKNALQKLETFIEIPEDRRDFLNLKIYEDEMCFSLFKSLKRELKLSELQKILENIIDEIFQSFHNQSFYHSFKKLSFSKLWIEMIYQMSTVENFNADKISLTG